jgi:hypothetical protein
MSKSLKCLFASFIAMFLFSSIANAEETPKLAGPPGTITLKDGSKIEAMAIDESYSIITITDKTQIIRKTEILSIIEKAPKQGGIIVLKNDAEKSIDAKSITESYTVITMAKKEQTINKSDIDKIVLASQPSGSKQPTGQLPSPAPSAAGAKGESRAEVIPLDQNGKPQAKESK